MKKRPNRKTISFLFVLFTPLLFMSSCDTQKEEILPLTEPVEQVETVIVSPAPVEIIPIQEVVEEEKEPKILPVFTSLLEQNEDIVGWISVEGTSINYPVMQSGDNDKYLRKDFFGEYSVFGTPFIDYRCSILPQSQNLILYGHATSAGALFGQLRLYLKDDSEDLPKITFTTLYEEQTYEVFAAFTTINEGDEILDYTKADFANPGDFQAFASKAKELSKLDCPLKPGITEKTLTIQTCSYGEQGEKLIVIAILIQ